MSLRRQLKRIRLARQLLHEYEADQATRLSWDDAVARVTAYGKWGTAQRRIDASNWKRAIERHIEDFPA